MDRRYKTVSTVLYKAKYDLYNHNTVTPNIKGNTLDFYRAVYDECCKSDIVHIHSQDKLVPWVKMMKKPVILHYHGSDIRGKWPKRKQYWSRADKLFYSTKDLNEDAPSYAEWFPNPVDTDLFYPILNHPDKDALTLSYNADIQAKELAEKHGYNLETLKREYKHNELPNLFRQYKAFIDIKHLKGAKFNEAYYSSGSLTGLEALACGLTVVNPYTIRTGLPFEHQASTASDQLFRVYREVSEC